jgi:hypothetical protein
VNPRTVTIKNLTNPITQMVGGVDFRADIQSISISRGKPVRAIAIAPDSTVDAVDLFPDGGTKRADAIRVSAGRPWVGHMDRSDAERIYVVPVRPAIHSALTAGDLVGSIDARIQVYTECEPYSLALGRAPSVVTLPRETAGFAFSIGVDPFDIVPVAGRSAVSLSFDIAAAGAATTEITIVGIDYGYDPGGSNAIIEIGTILHNSAGNADGDYAFAYEGIDYDAIFWQCVASAGVVDVSAVVKARD